MVNKLPMERGVADGMIDSDCCHYTAYVDTNPSPGQEIQSINKNQVNILYNMVDLLGIESMI